jgi:hypothetical protein
MTNKPREATLQDSINKLPVVMKAHIYEPKIEDVAEISFKAGYNQCYQLGHPNSPTTELEMDGVFEEGKQEVKSNLASIPDEELLDSCLLSEPEIISIISQSGQTAKFPDQCKVLCLCQVEAVRRRFLPTLAAREQKRVEEARIDWLTT